MEYRTIPHTGEKISVIGMGTSVAGEISAKNAAETFSYALENGINYFDCAGGHAANVDELKVNLGYLTASEEERDYSVISSLTPADTKGKCVYCKHCHPCPAGLDIGLINKYYDLSRMGDVLAKKHYLTLEKNASDCIQCGHCNSRCPFSVDQMSRMKEAASFFEK